MLFVLDMINIHDPGVPAASVPRLADGAWCQESSVLTTYSITDLTESFNGIVI